MDSPRAIELLKKLGLHFGRLSVRLKEISPNFFAMETDALALGRMFMLLIWLVLFGQSALSKISDWKGTRAWISDYFSKSILAPSSGMLLLVLTAVECAAALASGVGVGAQLLDVRISALPAQALSLMALLCIFFGQRVVKDYVAAANTAIYLGLGLLGCLLFQ